MSAGPLNEPLLIRDVRVDEGEGFQELSAMCGDFRLWYQIPAGFDVQPIADPFLLACLLPAMNAGRDIRIVGDAPLSPTLLENIDLAQQNFTLWNDYFTRYRKRSFSRVAVLAERVEEIPGKGGSAAFMSGGVDGLYTFLRQPEKIDTLIYIDGIDTQLDNPVNESAVAKLRAFLAPYGKQLALFRSNVRFLGHETGLSWLLCCGAGLASVAAAAGVGTCFIAASNANDEVVPDGSNAITDPLWSSARTRIVYDGAERTRNQRIAFIFDADARVADLLRVCWQDDGYNCGKCEKCLRTMVALELLGLRAATFPALGPSELRELSRERVYSYDDLVFLRENLRLARSTGATEIARALHGPIRNFQLRQLVKDFLTLVRGDF